MSCNFVLFEFGSTSLKCYYRFSELERVETHKLPWTISHDVYRTGRISAESTLKAVCAAQALLSCFGDCCEREKIVAFGTGVFREAENVLEFIHQIWQRTGLKLVILTEDQEAALLKSLCLSVFPNPPAFAFDLGGGSLQWVHIRSREASERGSIPIGAIRLLRLASDALDHFIPAIAGEIAGKFLLEVPETRLVQIAGTGGTVRSLARVTGKLSIRGEEIDALIRQTICLGPPEKLKAHRRPLFLPGLILLKRFLEETGAREVRYHELSIGKALLKKVLALYEESGEPLYPSQILKRVRYSAIIPATENRALI
jgi:exopolyphosphatase/pppGpp-phosphohydrolase